MKSFVLENLYRFFTWLEQFAGNQATKANFKILESSGKPHGRVISYDEICEQMRTVSSGIDKFMTQESTILKRFK